MTHWALPPPTVYKVALGKESKSETHSVVSNSLRPHRLYSPWNSPGQNTGVGSRSLLQEIFLTQGSNPGLPHCRQILYQLSQQGKELTGKMLCTLGLHKFLFIPSLRSPSLQTPERLQHHIPCLFCSSLIPSFQFLIIRAILAFLLSSRFLPFITITRDFTAKEIWNLTPGKFTTCRVASDAYILHCLCLMIWYFKYKVSPVSILFLFFACIPHVLQQPLLKGRQGRWYCGFGFLHSPCSPPMSVSRTWIFLGFSAETTMAWWLRWVPPGDNNNIKASTQWWLSHSDANEQKCGPHNFVKEWIEISVDS